MSKDIETYYCRYRVKNPGDEIWTVIDVEIQAESKKEAEHMLTTSLISVLEPDAKCEIVWLSTDYMFPF